MIRKTLFVIITFLSIAYTCYAQEQKEHESSRPSTDTEIVRICKSIDIEGTLYDDVTVTLKSISPDYVLNDHYKVKVLVEDENGKKIYKKTFKDCYLYIFSNGQLQVGKPKFNKILIQRGAIFDKLWFGKIREKEGIWDD